MLKHTQSLAWLAGETDPGALRTIMASAVQLMSQLRLAPRQTTHPRQLLAAAIQQMEEDVDLLGVLVAVAYPDRVAQRKDSSNR